MPETVSSRSVSCCLEKETNPQLSTTTLQEVVESDKVTSESPFLQAKQPQFPQSFFIRLVLQALHQPRCPPLDTLKHLNVLPKLRGTEVDTILKVWPHQCQVQGKNDLPAPAGHTIPDTGQDAIGPLSHQGTLLAHVQLAADQYPQVSFLLGTVQPHHPQPITLQGVIVAKVQDSALGLIKLHLVRLCPSIQLFQVSLQSHPIFQQIDTHSQLSVICKFTNERLHAFIHIINKNIEQNWPQHRPLRDTTGDWPPAGCSTIHQYSLGPAIQPVPNPAKSAPVQAMGCQLIQEYAVGDSVKGLAEIQIDNMHCPSCIHQAGHLVIKGDQGSHKDGSCEKLLEASHYVRQRQWLMALKMDMLLAKTGPMREVGNTCDDIFKKEIKTKSQGFASSRRGGGAHGSIGDAEIHLQPVKEVPMPGQNKQPQFPQLLQTLYQLCCPSLVMLQHLNVLAVKGPELDTVFEVQPHQCQKKGWKEDPRIYRHVSLTLVLGSVTEQDHCECHYVTCTGHQLIGSSQFGFMKGRSYLTDLISFYDKVTRLVYKGKSVDVVYLNFSKAFDTISHSILLEKLFMAWTDFLFTGYKTI
ncbi:hypothetical protein DUI87_13390 [Hirundo rustica rustica]|uniref:Reverse transcriptase domain-containing protein n=1 Tax=Hirundo rustica rustica TaxID=333673 RepID=A0A3M0KEG0_HIRRU|nr:hypothetical protein DUI87_13390 [Hirundo rustica rustica]